MVKWAPAAIVCLLCAAGTARAASVEEDLKTVRQRLVRSMLSRDEITPQRVIAEAREHGDALLPDGTWPDIDYTNQRRADWPVAQHLHRVRLMARAWRMQREAGTRDEKLLGQIRSALDEWLRRDLRNPNWWHNEIGVPITSGGAALLVQEELSPQQIDGVVRLMRRSIWKNWTGQNLMWGVTIQIMRGLIENDAQAVAEAYTRLYEEIRITDTEGVQADFSFHQHGAQLYNGGYGQWFGADAARYASLSWGTRWQIPDRPMNVLLSYLLDGQQWMMHRDRMDYSVKGREIVRKGKRAGQGAAYEFAHAVTLLSEQPVPRQQEVVRFAQRLHGQDDSALIGNRHFWRSDYMAHHAEGWMASVRMFSTRMINTELVNDEGKKSHHLADGANYIYVHGNEYHDIFPCWDWTKVPGTTAEQGTLDIDEPRAIGIKGKTNFVGGVSDGEFGLAVMELARGKLAARKAWFFFGDGYLCLGAGITCESDRAVATSVNQCLSRPKAREGANWVHHDRIGYLFPDRKNVRVDTATREGRWSDIGTGPETLEKRDVFSLWIDHGVRPAGAAYQYIVLPNATAKQTNDAANDSQIIVFSNNDALQAALHREQMLVAAAFWEPGRLRFAEHSVQVDQPCLVLLHRGRDPMRLSVANPKNEAMTVNVVVDGKAITIDLPGGEMAGSTITVTPP